MSYYFTVPDLNPSTNKKLQELAFVKGWKWRGSSSTLVKHINATNLTFHISSKSISYGTSMNHSHTDVILPYNKALEFFSNGNTLATALFGSKDE